MGGPTWTDDENRILEYMWKQGKTDIEISAVLVTRGELAIRTHRIAKGWVHKKEKKVVINVVKPVIEQPISTPKHSDNLPDIGEQLSKLIRIAERVDSSILTMVRIQEDTYELFKRIDTDKKP